MFADSYESDEGEQLAAETQPARPPADNPDRWPLHPAGPAGDWLRAKVERSWEILKTATGKDLFNPPATDTKKPKQDQVPRLKALAIERAEEPPT